MEKHVTIINSENHTSLHHLTGNKNNINYLKPMYMYTQSY
jgi:hypothetical protein